MQLKHCKTHLILHGILAHATDKPHFNQQRTGPEAGILLVSQGGQYDSDLLGDSGMSVCRSSFQSALSITFTTQVSAS